MNSFSITSHTDEPLRGHFFLEASAGTGKTFTIEHLVVQLLIKEPALSLDQILIVTFTKAATRDLKQRIYQTLQTSLLQWKEKDIAAPEYLQATFDDERVFLRLERASSIIERAEIYTIHSFCKKMLSTYAFEAKMPIGDFEEEEDSEAILETLRTLKPYQEFSPNQLTALLQKHGKEMPKLCQALKRTSPVEAPSFTMCWEKEAPSFSKEAFDETFSEDPKVTLSRLANFVGKTLRLSPDEFLEEMQEKLNIPSFVEKVRSRFSAAIIDEFQDTDPLQWEIFRRLFVEKPIPLLCLVGDPKQSIYAFRKADLATFVKARNLFDPKRLSRNYRSHPELIHAMNELFDEKSHWLSLDETQGDVCYTPVEAKEDYQEQKIEDGKKSIHFFLLKQAKGRARKWPTEKMEETLLFPRIAKEIQHLHTLNLSYGQMVILIKDRYQAERLTNYLTKLSIPTMTKSTGHIGETKAFSLFYDFINLLQNPSHIRRLKKLLSHPLSGWSLEDLSLTLHDAPVQEALIEAKEWATLYQEKGLARAIEEWMESLSLSLDDRKDLMQLSEIALEEKLSLRDLLLKFETLLSKDPEEDTRLKRRAFHDGDFVHIMTTHSSKGLEFDVVFALGLMSRQQQEENPSKEKDQEKMRLLYVALTRAKRRIYIPFCEITDQKKCTPGLASPIEIFLSRLASPTTWEKTYDTIPKIDVKSLLEERASILSFEEIGEDTPSPSVKEKAPLLIPPPKVEISYIPMITQSFSGSREKKFMKTEDSILPKGAEMGNFFHELFEMLLAHGFYRDELLMKKALTKKIVPSPFASWEKEIIELVEKAFSIPLDGFSLKEIPPEHLLQEVEFLFKEEVYWKGFADLIFYREGRYHLLDWKLHVLENYQESTLARVMEEGGYLDQAAIYRKALKTIIPENELGKTFYLFVRGPGVYQC